MFALVDCNNFYASCERLFRPDLNHAAIVVLSNNDGCVIARSNEAKALGINMGEPFFKLKSLVKKHHVEVFSSNYTLYGDLSQRVMRVIEESWPDVEIYSIDEAFLDLSSLASDQHECFCLQLQQKIQRYTGIPTSIGIGPSKRSFGQMQTQLTDLAQAISQHAARVCEKARAQDLVAERVQVFVRSNPFRQDLAQYANSMEYRLVNPTNDTRVITHIAKRCLKKLFKSGVHYKKVGVMLVELRPKNLRQLDIFNPLSLKDIQHSDQLMSVFDQINARFGRHTVRLAAQGYGDGCRMRCAMCSPCYTTSWSDLAVVGTSNDVFVCM